MNTMLDRLLLSHLESSRAFTLAHAATRGNDDMKLEAAVKAQNLAQLRHAVLELDKAGMLTCDYKVQRGNARCYRKTCKRCKLIRELK